MESWDLPYKVGEAGIIIFSLSLLFFGGLHLQNMEVPQPGEPMLLQRQYWILNPITPQKNSLFFFFCLFCLRFFRATPMAYGGSQARGPIGAVATGLCHSHSNARSELHLRPTPQLKAQPDP